MMVSEVPQIDVSSLSRQQLQHLLETSRRTGRTDMADAVAHEMRERRAQPETPRSWVQVDFSEVASAPGSEPAPEPEPQSVAGVADEVQEAPPRQDAAPSVGPAEPYAFSALRAVRDDGLRVGAATPVRGARTRARPTRTGAGVARPRTGLALGAVAVGAAAVAAVAAMVPLQSRQILPAEATVPAATNDQPAARAAVALTLRGPIASPLEPMVPAAPAPAPPPAPGPVPAPAPRGAFTIAAAELKAAADRADRIDRAKAAAEGLQGTWISPDFAAARCRWSPSDPTLAICQTRTRYAASRPWRERTGHYRRDADGAWQVAP